MDHRRGFTLVELLIGVGIIAMVTLTSVGATMASRSMAVTAAAARFDALLDAARTTARAFPDGATLVFAPDAYGDGVIIRLYRGRPAAGTMVAENTPPLETRAAITETQALSAPGYALVIHADGRIRGVAHYALGATGTTELGCPSLGAFHFSIAYASGKADRYVPCHIPLTATAQVSFATPAAASTSSPPPVVDGCYGAIPGCAPLPPPTASSAGCPPGTVTQPSGLCYVPLAPGSCSVTGATNTTLTLTCSPPSGGSSNGFAVQQYFAHQSGTLVCNWSVYTCTAGGLSGNTTYAFSPLFGDSLGNRAWGSDFSGHTAYNPLVAGACSATQDPGSPTTTLDVSCSAPSGGTGTGYAVQIYVAHQTGTLVCNWSTFSCATSGLSPNTTYPFSPLFGDAAGARAWGADFQATTAMPATPPTPAPTAPPAPPQGCPIDTMGNGVCSTFNGLTPQQCVDAMGAVSVEPVGTISYNIWVGANSSYLQANRLYWFTDQITDVGNCLTQDNWQSPGEPSAILSDPNLP